MKGPSQAGPPTGLGGSVDRVLPGVVAFVLLSGTTCRRGIWEVQSAEVEGVTELEEGSPVVLRFRTAIDIPTQREHTCDVYLWAASEKPDSGESPVVNDEITVEVTARQITEDGSAGATSTETWVVVDGVVVDYGWQYPDSAGLSLRCPDDATACEVTVEFELTLVGEAEFALPWTADARLTGPLTVRENCGGDAEPVNATVTLVQVD